MIIWSSLIACRLKGDGWFPVAVSGVDAAPGLKSIHRTHDSLAAPVAALTLVAIRPSLPCRNASAARAVRQAVRLPDSGSQALTSRPPESYYRRDAHLPVIGISGQGEHLRALGAGSAPGGRQSMPCDPCAKGGCS